MEHARQRARRQGAGRGFFDDLTIGVAHDCSVLGIPFDSARLFTEPPADYALGLQMVIERVSSTNRVEAERAEARMRAR
jgi:hypothetical protein